MSEQSLDDDNCWHYEEYRQHCWRPIPNNLAGETAARCDICGKSKGSGAHILPDGGTRSSSSLNTDTGRRGGSQ